MKVHVEEVSPIERKLYIEVEQPRVAMELDRAYAELSRRVKIAGFRPGRVPRRILEQRFREQVEDDVIRRVVETAYSDAVKQQEVEPVSLPQVSNDPLRQDAPFTFQARVQVKPKVEVKDYLDLPLKKVAISVEEARVDQQLESLRQSMSRLEPVEARSEARAGDFAVVDYEATIGGKPFPGGRAENTTVEIAPGELVDSKIPALEGAQVGATVELDYPFPQAYPVAELQGKKAHFRVLVKGLKLKVVPDLNDELAQELQGGSTLQELRTKVRSDLETIASDKAASEEREQLAAALIERNPIEVPPAMVDRAAEAMVNGGIQAMARGGIDPRRLNIDFGKLLEEVRPRALKEVKTALLLEAIAVQEKLEVSDQELEKRIEELAKGAGQPAAKVRKHFREPQERKSLERRLREEKTVEFLKSRAKYQ
jgi:trigger factor